MAKFIEVTETNGQTQFINIDYIIRVVKIGDDCCIYLNENLKDCLHKQPTNDIDKYDRHHISEINQKLLIQLSVDETYYEVVEMIKKQTQG